MRNMYVEFRFCPHIDMATVQEGQAGWEVFLNGQTSVLNLNPHRPGVLVMIGLYPSPFLFFSLPLGSSFQERV